MVNTKRYNILEQTLQTIIAEYISLPKDAMNLNNKILGELLEDIIDTCKEDLLFDQLYTGELFYGGSYYDGLKINMPDEYDIDVKLSIPYSDRIKPSDNSGYVNLKLPRQPKPKDPSLYSKGDRRRRRAYYGKRGLHVLIDGDDFLNTEKVMIWMHKILSTWLGGYKMGRFRVSSKVTSYGTFKVKLVRNGPAFTFRASKPNGPVIKFDLVPCFEIDSSEWPIQGFRRNPFPDDKNGFFIVPKPVEQYEFEKISYNWIYWRVSFPEQERKLIDSRYNLKPALRLLKKMRDKLQHHEIKSYFIKTVVLWKLQETSRRKNYIWTKPLSYVFIELLKYYQRFIADRRIPHFWYENFNLIKHVDPEILFQYNEDLKHAIKDIKEHPDDEFVVAQYLLSRRQFNNFMEEPDES